MIMIHIIVILAQDTLGRARERERERESERESERERLPSHPSLPATEPHRSLSPRFDVTRAPL